MSTLYKVQVGAYKEKKNAEKIASKLKKLGYSAIIVKETDEISGHVYENAIENISSDKTIIRALTDKIADIISAKR